MTAIEDPVARRNPEAAWSWVRSLIAEISTERSRENVARRFYEWDFAVRQFRRVEFNTFLDGKPSEAVLRGHKHSLNALIKLGNDITEDYERFGSVDLSNLQITPGCVRDYAASLQETFDEWHHPRNPAEIAAIQEKLFGAAS